MLFCAIIAQMEHLRDNMNCIFDSNSGLSEDYVRHTCWTNGFFIYKELEKFPELSILYGIPGDIRKVVRYTVSIIVPCS